MKKVPCSACDGKGKIINCICPACSGSGSVFVSNSLIISLDLDEESDRA